MYCDLALSKIVQPKSLTKWLPTASYTLSYNVPYTGPLYVLCNTYMTSWLTHWGRVTHICVGNLTIIASDNGLSPERRQAIIWTNAGILLIGPLGTNFSEILSEILTFSLTKMRLKVSSAKRRPFCLGLNELIDKFFLSLYSQQVTHWFPSITNRWRIDLRP